MTARSAQPSDAQQSRYPSLVVELPAWVAEFVPPPEHVYATVEERMELAVELSRANVARGTGGPFGAAVFDNQTHRLVAPGVNIVVPSHWSGGHGEMVAMAIAQQVARTHDLGGPGFGPHELVTSCEPCSMCFGALPWSGVKRLVCAASEQDARDIGFDEGPKPADWAAALESRGIEVVLGVLREKGANVLRDYAASGGAIYNGRLEG